MRSPSRDPCTQPVPSSAWADGSARQRQHRLRRGLDRRGRAHALGFHTTEAPRRAPPHRGAPRPSLSDQTCGAVGVTARGHLRHDKDAIVAASRLSRTVTPLRVIEQAGTHADGTEPRQFRVTTIAFAYTAGWYIRASSNKTTTGVYAMTLPTGKRLMEQHDLSSIAGLPKGRRNGHHQLGCG